MPKKTTSSPKKAPSGLLPLLKYKELIAGFMDQGIPHDDAVATLREGMRQANGRSPSAATQL